MPKQISIRQNQQENEVASLLGDASSFIQSNTDAEVNFTAVRSTLAQEVQVHEGLVHVTNQKAGNFYAISEVALLSIVDKAINQTKQMVSFFDGMDDFQPETTVGLSALTNLEQRSSEYSDKTIDKLKRLRLGSA